MNAVVQKAVHPRIASDIHSATCGLLPFIQKACVVRFHRLQLSVRFT
jgi:mitotic spindle assembly checkpoint protein MAD2B